MEQIKTLKRNALIKGIDISSSFYVRLSSLFVALSSPEELLRQKEENEQEYKDHIETMAILFATIDEKAEEQGLTEMSELKDFSS